MTHVSRGESDFVDIGFRFGEVIYKSHYPGHQLGRTLYFGKAGFLEEGRVEQDPQHGYQVVIRAEILFFKHMYGARILGRGVLPRWDLRFVGNEEIVKVP